MDKAQFLLKLLLLGFELKPVTRSLTLYTYKQALSVDFFLLRTGTEVVRLYTYDMQSVIYTTINAKYEELFEHILKELGITNDYVQGKLKEKDSKGAIR